jgi:hypothetical protein
MKRLPSQLPDMPLPDDQDVLVVEKKSEGKLKGTKFGDLKTAITSALQGLVNALQTDKIPYQNADKPVNLGVQGFNAGGVSVKGVSVLESADLLRKIDWETPCFIKTAYNEVKIKAGTSVVIGGTIVTYNSDTTIDLPALTAGEDYSVWVSENGDIEALHDPYENPAPKVGAIKIGGFHYSVVPSGESSTGNKTEADMVKIRGINEYSLWDLKFRWANGQPRGMVYTGGIWADIYMLSSEHITYGSSRFDQWIAGGATSNGRKLPKVPLKFGGNGSTTYGEFTWFVACELAKSHNKRLPSYEEFQAMAYGVNEGKSSADNSYETTAGKIEHYSNLTSACGIEQATGVQYTWGSDFAGVQGTGWKNEAGERGQIYGTVSSPVAVRLGGDRGSGSFAGSRCSVWSYQVWDSGWSSGVRCVGDHLQLA